MRTPTASVVCGQTTATHRSSPQSKYPWPAPPHFAGHGGGRPPTSSPPYESEEAAREGSIFSRRPSIPRILQPLTYRPPTKAKRHLKAPRQNLTIPPPSSNHSSWLDRFSRPSAVPEGLNLVSREFKGNFTTENEAPRSAGYSTKLESIPQSPEDVPTVPQGMEKSLQRRTTPRTTPQRRQDSREVSRGRSLVRKASRSARRLSYVTPQDLVVPYPGFVHEGPDRLSHASETLGLSRRESPMPEMEEMGEIERVSRSDSDPPDGGWLAWATAWAGFLVTFNCWGFNTAFGVFEAFYAFLPGVVLLLSRVQLVDKGTCPYVHGWKLAVWLAHCPATDNAVPTSL